MIRLCSLLLAACIFLVSCTSLQVVPTQLPAVTLAPPLPVPPAATATPLGGQPSPLATQEPGASPVPTLKAACPSAVSLPTGPEMILALSNSAPMEQYAPIELDIALPGGIPAVKNPFDPAEIDLQVSLSSPDGHTLRVPAFWYQEYDPQGRVPCGEPRWKARFTPSLPGNWSAYAILAQNNRKSRPVQFDVAASKRNGFVRINPKTPRFFTFDNGKTFFPVGINLGWQQNDPLVDYAHWLDALQANGATVARVWMADWSFAIEWKDTGLGDYTQRLRQAWYLDQVFKMAEQRGVYIELVLINHGAFTADVNPEWADNPYNSVNGGPLKNPEEFATNALARQLFQRRLRYIAARWAASPALFAWEWWNEANWTAIPNLDMAAWIKTMTVTLRQFDPYRHLVSTSYASPMTPAEILALPEIDFLQVHLYDSRDTMLSIPESISDLLKLTPLRPILLAEFGFSASTEDETSYDPHGNHLHNGLWTAAFSGYSGSSLYWWWDTYVDKLNLWGQYATLTHFIKDEDMALYKPGAGKLSPAMGKALVLQAPDRALAWVKSSQFEAVTLGTPAPIQGATLTLTNLPDGRYQARWYDPTSAQWLESGEVQSADKTLTLNLPTFNQDLAVKVAPLP
jgi:hypothetical protein